MRHQIGQAAVFGQPFGRGFWPHFVYARHIVHRVAHQGLKIQHQCGRHAKLGFHAGGIAPLAIHGVYQNHALIHQLRQIFIAAADDGLQPLLIAYARQCAQHIVGFNAADHQHLPAQQCHHAVYGRDLQAQIIGHGAAIGFVFRVNSVAKSRPTGIKHHGAVAGWGLLFQRQQHIHHAAHCARRGAHAIARIGTQIGHGVKSTVEVAGAIDQQQGVMSLLGYRFGGRE